MYKYYLKISYFKDSHLHKRLKKGLFKFSHNPIYILAPEVE